MEIIILITAGLVCLALGFFITKVILGKDLTTLQLKVENYEKIIDEKSSEIVLLKKNFEIIQDQYHQNEIFLQKVTTELEERNKALIVTTNDFQRIQNEKIEIEILKNKKEQEFSGLNAKFDEMVRSHYEQLEILKATHNERYEDLLSQNNDLKSLSTIHKDTLERKNQQYLELSNELIELKTSLEEREKNFSEQTSNFEKQKLELTNQFKALANDILDAKTISLQETSKIGISAVINPFQQSIDSFKKEVQEIHNRETMQQGELRQELSQLKELNQKITLEAHQLATALKGQKKTQGNWGELILENVLERSGLQLGKDFQREVSVTMEEGRLRPDAIVYLPQNKHLIIDSKVSLNSYTQYINSDNEQDRRIALMEHVKAISDRINELSAKEYYKIKGINSPEIVFMFIPIESAFVEALKADESIFQKALEKNILVATPTTLLTSLNIVRQLWRFEEQNKHTAALASKADAVFQKLRVFLDSFKDIKKYLDKAAETYQKSENQLISGKGNLLKQVNEFKALAPAIQGNLPQDLIEKADLEIEYTQLTES
ncbi:DNA recombination protein RmuC [Acinetobacter sp. ANC 4805]|uniref:DNA recombination protein RmuC n=1 Tax=Acinetobacter sp. ANC 4805 TaxID=2923425 RepID=UPI001F4B0EAB|nr:DNA recombination protein RmuC [Acinetobacter sp. ANC 4805]MCH7310031.1 DNA recombination protein RmuC [Acinetobacter sp. ANC 4805]